MGRRKKKAAAVYNVPGAVDPSSRVTPSPHIPPYYPVIATPDQTYGAAAMSQGFMDQLHPSAVLHHALVTKFDPFVQGPIE